MVKCNIASSCLETSVLVLKGGLFAVLTDVHLNNNKNNNKNNNNNNNNNNNENKNNFFLNNTSKSYFESAIERN